MGAAVIFDWFGTLASYAHASPTNYETVLAEFGVEVEPARIEAYLLSWDGVDHAEHSASRETYLAWTRWRLASFVAECGVAECDLGGVVDALVSSDRTMEMVTFPESQAVLEELRGRGFRIGICSNWGWDLDPVLEETGIAPLVDVPVTSARAGYRKPHPRIYTTVLERLGVDAAGTVFVGDSWGPDVLGPLALGMTPVHVWRNATRTPPELVDGVHRVRSLDELFALGLVG